MNQSRLAFEALSVQEKYQSEQLGDLLKYLLTNSAFYGRHLKNASTDIRSIRDLPSLPTTSKTDLQQHNFDFLCTPRSAIKEYTTTSGTLGNPVTIALTEADLQRLAYNEHQSFLTADGSPKDCYQLMLTLDRQFMAGMAYYSGIRRMGAAVLRTGPGLPQMQWEAMERTGANTLVTVPSFLVQMIQWAKSNGKEFAGTSLRSAICIGEGIRNPDFSLNALGQKITEHWPLKLYSTYAATELQTAYTECCAGNGGHEQPDLIITEIIDEDGNPVAYGKAGEVTITTLRMEGMPLLRYRTGDIAVLHNEACSCGRISRRLGPVIGRRQQMIKYRGTTLYPPAIFNLLNAQDYITGYVVEVLKDVLGMDLLKLHLHTKLIESDCESLLRPVMQATLRVSPPLHFHTHVAMMAMQHPEGSRKVIRFLDNR